MTGSKSLVTDSAKAIGWIANFGSGTTLLVNCCWMLNGTNGVGEGDWVKVFVAVSVIVGSGVREGVKVTVGVRVMLGVSVIEGVGVII